MSTFVPINTYMKISELLESTEISDTAIVYKDGHVTIANPKTFSQLYPYLKKTHWFAASGGDNSKTENKFFDSYASRGNFYIVVVNGKTYEKYIVYYNDGGQNTPEYILDAREKQLELPDLLLKIRDNLQIIKPDKLKDVLSNVKRTLNGIRTQELGDRRFNVKRTDIDD